jgi:hypothetical protein
MYLLETEAVCQRHRNINWRNNEKDLTASISLTARKPLLHCGCAFGICPLYAVFTPDYV